MTLWRRRRRPVRRAEDNVALGAYQWAARPRPHGVDTLGRKLLEAQGGLEAALGALALEACRHREGP